MEEAQLQALTAEAETWVVAEGLVSEHQYVREDSGSCAVVEEEELRVVTEEYFFELSGPPTQIHLMVSFICSHLLPFLNLVVVKYSGLCIYGK